ncbi:CHAT domain-containing protein [Actinomadura sp. HBU206391]|nr:CHAT domain-containing protein [Actinomadura sp. HBU206391]
MALSRPDKALAEARAVLADSPGPFAASVAHQAIGVVLRDFGDTSAALRELRAAQRHARRSGDPSREPDVLATLGIALVFVGRTAAGLAALDGAIERSQGTAAARIRFRRVGVLNVLGRHREALEDLRRVIPVLTRAGDALWSARAHTARGVAHLALGSPGRADADFRTADRLYAETGQQVEAVFSVHNRGLTAFRLGDLPTALARLDEAGRRYGALGAPVPELAIDRCSVLLAAGLAADALAEADAGIRQLTRISGQATRKAELLLMAARAALAAGDPATAVTRATAASGSFSAQHREWWGAHARLTLLQARFAAGLTSGRLLRESARTAQRLGALESAESAQAHLLAGRTALALGRLAEADRHLSEAARARRRGPALSRTAGWLAQALRAQAQGLPRGLLSACRRGLDLLDDHRLTLGASELRAQATEQGAELAALAQRECLRAGRSRDLLAWTERWRATALSVPPVHPPGDHALQAELTAFREISSRLERARADGTPATELRLGQQRLEREIRGRMMHLRGTGPAGDRLDIGGLLDELKDQCLVEIVEIDGELHLLVCGDGRVRRIPAGRIADAAAEAEFAGSALRRLAYEPSSGEHVFDLLEATAGRLERAVLGSAARLLGDGPVVMVPPGRLHGVPWALLPSLRDRPLSVAPSATAWLRARTAVPPESRDVVLVRGPGLRTGGAEVTPLAARYGDATVLEHGTATASRVLSAIDGCRLAHVAAHGSFRADSPMFSSLHMDDGPLTVHDVERLTRAPYRLVLSSCDSGRLAPAGAHELLGLAAALLPLGTAGIVAGLVPVNDEATVPLMLALHEALHRGAGLPEALRDARRAVPDEPVHRATALSFIALGSG